MKRGYTIIVLVLTIIIGCCTSVPVRAAVLKEKSEDRFKELCIKAKEINIDSEVKELMDGGMSKEDAEYYITLNNLVKLLENENLQVLLEDGIPDISDYEFSTNKAYYRKKILEGDKIALKKALCSLDTLINGGEYAEKLISTFSDKAAVEIIYPDGSKITYDTRLKESLEKEERERSFQRGNENQLEVVSSWQGNKNHKYKPVRIDYEETLMEEGVTYAYDNPGWREGEWSFESGLSYSKVYLYAEFQLSSNGISQIEYARGGQASYGIVNIANSTGGVVARHDSRGEEFPAEARNEVVFTVSGSFGASFLVLSLAMEPGMNWTQYIIFRLYDTENIDGEYAAKYEWYAADYK